MDNKKRELLNGKEQKSVLDAIYDLTKEYPELNGLVVKFESFQEKGSSLAIFSEPGAHVNRRFITGAFEGIVPFSIVYRASPNQDQHKINMITFLEKLADWLSESGDQSLTDDRRLTKIEAVTVASKDMANGAGDNDYVIVLNATYRKEN